MVLLNFKNFENLNEATEQEAKWFCPACKGDMRKDQSMSQGVFKCKECGKGFLIINTSEPRVIRVKETPEKNKKK